jgi:Surface antigen variable number repeat
VAAVYPFAMPSSRPLIIANNLPIGAGAYYLNAYILRVVPSPMYLRPIFIAIFLILISSDSLRPQSLECVDRPPSAFHKSQRIKINIVSVEFRGENSLSDTERSQVVESIQRSNVSVSATEPDTYWVNGLGHVANKTLHAQGHLGDRTKVTPYLVSAEPSQRSYAVSIEIETGPQYLVRTLQVVESTAFTPTELMKQIHLSPGEGFDEDKIWQSIKSMRRMYGAKGYIDMTAGYNVGTHQNQPLVVDVSVQVVEGKQYRVGTVQILGLGATAENLVKSILEPGQVFDSQSFTDFLNENRNLLPVDASDNDIKMGRNLDDGTLDIALDFRRCPGDKIPFPAINVSVPIWDKSQFMALSDRWFHVSD